MVSNALKGVGATATTIAAKTITTERNTAATIIIAAMDPEGAAKDYAT